MKATEVTAGLAESNGSLLPGLWRDSLHVTCGLTACTPESAPGPTLGNEYRKTFYLLRASNNDSTQGLHTLKSGPDSSLLSSGRATSVRPSGHQAVAAMVSQWPARVSTTIVMYSRLSWYIIYVIGQSDVNDSSCCRPDPLSLWQSMSRLFAAENIYLSF